MQRVEPLLERGVEALEAEVEVRRRKLELDERKETNRHAEAQAGRTTALEHVRGAWAAVQAMGENKAVIVTLGGGVGWLVGRLSDWVSAWWATP